MRFWSSLTTVLVLDQFSKYWLSSHLPQGSSRPLLDGFLYLTLVHNRGAAFGLFWGWDKIFLFCAAIVILGIIIYQMKYHPADRLAIYMGLLAGGAWGNLIDRLRLGYVVDFLDLRWWPVFNIADVAIVCGGILLVLHLYINEGKKNKRIENGGK
ncbi:signal peptidase II [Syntrophomonas palmitatica]|uniref:signal peptidase II n=1 Tax=Syntrophomonas palmitatica TaxID=402877 RepID=UPI0006D045EC|nr:signal peptidase II [Syntrophomonas palmitatica]